MVIGVVKKQRVISKWEARSHDRHNGSTVARRGGGGFGGVDSAGTFDPERGGNGYGAHNYSCYHHVRVSDAAVLDYRNSGIHPVSYTHLTLPTNREV